MAKRLVLSFVIFMPQWAEPQRHMVVGVCVCMCVSVRRTLTKRQRARR